MIYTTDKGILLNCGLDIFGKLYRQLRIGNYGIIDLLEVRRFNYNDCAGFPQLKLIIYELKKDKISVSALMQAMKYVKGIDSYLKKRNTKLSYEISVRLIGKEINMEDTSLPYLPFIIPIHQSKTNFLEFFEYKFDAFGLRFEYFEPVKLENEGF